MRTLGDRIYTYIKKKRGWGIFLGYFWAKANTVESKTQFLPSMRNLAAVRRYFCGDGVEPQPGLEQIGFDGGHHAADIQGAGIHDHGIRGRAQGVHRAAPVLLVAGLDLGEDELKIGRAALGFKL